MPVSTYPSMTVDDNGTVYVVWASHEGGPAASFSDIYFVKGLPTASQTSFNWSPRPRQLNPVSTGDQWHPWITWDDCSKSLAVVVSRFLWKFTSDGLRGGVLQCIPRSNAFVLGLLCASFSTLAA